MLFDFFFFFFFFKKVSLPLSPSFVSQEQVDLETSAVQSETVPASASLLASQKTSSTDLSDIPALPANPIPVIKNSIKLRLNR